MMDISILVIIFVIVHFILMIHSIKKYNKLTEEEKKALKKRRSTFNKEFGSYNTLTDFTLATRRGLTNLLYKK